MATHYLYPLRPYRIAERNLAGLRARFDKMAKLAKRLGLTPPVLEVIPGSRVVTETRDETGLAHYRAHVLATVTPGQTPKIAGYAYLATLEHVTTGATLVRAPYGSEGLTSQWGEAPPWCDHCKAKRARKDTYLVRSEGGETLQLGRSCLAHYMPAQDVERFLAMAEWQDVERLTADADSLGGLASGPPSQWEVPLFVSWTVAAIRAHGWLSKGKANDMGMPNSATATLVLSRLTVTPEQLTLDAFKEEAAIERTAADDSEAKRILAKASTMLNSGELGDYEHNLRVSLLAPVIDRRAGLAASVVSYVRRAEAKAEEAAKEKADTVDAWLPGASEGQRLDLEVACMGMHAFAGYYGTRTLVKLRTPEGYVLHWWASGDRTEETDLKSGRAMHATLTVKRLDTDKRSGLKVTTVERVSLSSLADFKAATAMPCPHCKAPKGTWCHGKAPKLSRCAKSHARRVKALGGVA